MMLNFNRQHGNDSKTHRQRRGISLVEILMALLILSIAVLPAVGTFSNYYGVATRQMDQEIALKLGESVISLLMNTAYSDLAQGKLTDLPMNFQTPSGSIEGTLSFNGYNATGTIEIGRVKHVINSSISKVFTAQNLDSPHKNALQFTWQSADPPPPMPIGAPPPPPGSNIASYSCFDDLLCIKVSVHYGPGNPIELAVFRADMTK